MAGVVVELPALVAEIALARSAGKRVVLTNGVFDLLHVGHLRYLSQARGEGDLLVVGVNADASVRALKPGRPMVPESERAELVAALGPVDYAVIFAEPTADQLLRLVRPDAYVKGGDYTADSLPEAATAREVGARLVIVPLVPNHSSSALARALGEGLAPDP
jgi:rfaE bifunctional protein nucleotidyltransferase chain/domain